MLAGGRSTESVATGVDCLCAAGVGSGITVTGSQSDGLGQRDNLLLDRRRLYHLRRHFTTIATSTRRCCIGQSVGANRSDLHRGGPNVGVCATIGFMFFT